MKGNQFAMAALVLLIACSVMAGDLCLIGINDYKQLETVRNIAVSAHGAIGGCFITNLDEIQISQLKAKGVTVEILVKDCAFSEYYVVSEHHPVSKVTPIFLSPLYSHNFNKIVRLDEGDADVLERAGYRVVSISDKKTPFFFNPPEVSAPLRDSYPEDSLADLVNQDSLYCNLTRLEAFQTRFLMTDSILRAGDWIETKFRSYGYTDIWQQRFLVTNDHYGVFNWPCYNVICYKEGTVYPEKLIVIGAHYDSYNGGPSDGTVFAPGADDNASGTAGVLELARIFSTYESKKSIVFAAFSAEEIGIFGATAMADSMYEAASDVELMSNLDMIGHWADGNQEIIIGAGLTTAYYDVFAAAGERVAGLVPIYADGPWWDDGEFGQYGWPTLVFHDGDWPYGNCHTDYDVSDSINFDYLENNVRMVAASIGIVDEAPAPIACTVEDIGDGQSLQVSWDDCRPENNYQVIYGTSVYSLNDTIDVPPVQCSYDVGGLVEGETYYFGVDYTDPEGNGPLSWKISNNVPWLRPRMPKNLAVEPDSARVVLSWESNSELDFSHYKIIRKHGELPWEVIAELPDDTVYYDTGVEAHQIYAYAVLAVDMDSFESDTTAIFAAGPATFDGGVLFVDETQTDDITPGEVMQNQFYSAAFDTVAYTVYTLNDSAQCLSRSRAGQYNPIIWIDDDLSTKLLAGSLDSLKWYLDWHTDFLVAGWQTIFSFTGQTYFYPGNFFYDDLGITSVARNVLADFVGATGVGDWPDLELKDGPIYHGKLPNIEIFGAAPGAEVICTFNSYSGSTFYGGKPVGIAYDSHHGKRIVLGFPVYWLTEESAAALMARVFEYFAEESVLYGDVNGDWGLNILDITYLINYLYKGGPAPIDMNNGDLNGSCVINILDVTYLISYLYKGGPAPLAGCVQ
ncbi:MAG: M20/M25/M40 family metallo-hydrolase [Candidatus Zixiibacteriota bacterium]